MLKFENDAAHVHTGFAVMERSFLRNRIPNEHRERIVRAFEDPRGKRRGNLSDFKPESLAAIW